MRMLTWGFHGSFHPLVAWRIIGRILRRWGSRVWLEFRCGFEIGRYPSERSSSCQRVHVLPLVGGDCEFHWELEVSLRELKIAIEMERRAHSL